MVEDWVGILTTNQKLGVTVWMAGVKDGLFWSFLFICLRSYNSSMFKILQLGIYINSSQHHYQTQVLRICKTHLLTLNSIYRCPLLNLNFANLPDRRFASPVFYETTFCACAELSRPPPSNQTPAQALK